MWNRAISGTISVSASNKPARPKLQIRFPSHFTRIRVKRSSSRLETSSTVQIDKLEGEGGECFSSGGNYEWRETVWKRKDKKSSFVRCFSVISLSFDETFNVVESDLEFLCEILWECEVSFRWWVFKFCGKRLFKLCLWYEWVTSSMSWSKLLIQVSKLTTFSEINN